MRVIFSDLHLGLLFLKLAAHACITRCVRFPIVFLFLVISGEIYGTMNVYDREPFIRVSPFFCVVDRSSRSAGQREASAWAEQRGGSFEGVINKSRGTFSG